MMTLRIPLLSVSLAALTGCPPVNRFDPGYIDEVCIELPDKVDIRYTMEGEYDPVSSFEVGVLPVVNTCGFAVTAEVWSAEIRQGPQRNDETSNPTVSAPRGGVRIPAGATSDIPMLFQPVGPTTVRGFVQMVGPDGTEYSVEFDAVSIAPDLTLSTPQVELRDVPLGCSHEQPLVLKNEGEADLVITELGFEEEQAVTGLEVDGVAELPWTLAPGEEATVTLRYAPQEVAAASGVRLRLRSNHFYRAATASSTGPWVYYSAVESGSCE